MRVALLAASGLLAATLEGFVESHPGAGVEIVWTVMEPGSILAALDHAPDLFLLDMRWREQALAAAQTLQDLGAGLIICLFEHLDDPLIGDALAMGLDIFQWSSPTGALLEHIQATG
ncbi:MAG TPA: hypothetical protein VD969_20930 [Symbiobacteriaceae bacterium]|nr:hypothetical protein [Symbiobacteriaceae bacterium]